MSDVPADDPNYAKALTRLACIYAAEGYSQLSLDSLKHACKVDPSYKKASSTLYKLCQLMLQRPEPAITEVEDIIQFMITYMGKTSNTWNLLAKCADLKGDKKMAFECYVKAGESGSSQGWSQAGIIARDAGLVSDAKVYFKKAYELNNRNADALVGLGNIYSDANKDAKARQHYAAGLYLGNAEAAFKMAQCLHYGLGGVYDISLAHICYCQSLQGELSPIERKRREMLAQIVLLQDPSANLDTDETRAIQGMVERLVATQLAPNDATGKHIVAEAHCAAANVHLIRSRQAQKKLVDNKARIERLKKDFIKNKDRISAIVTQTIEQQSIMNTSNQEALQHLRFAECLDDNARYKYAVAELMQQCFFPAKAMAQMTKEEQFYCVQAQAFYKEIILKNIISQIDNDFVFKARCNLSKIYRHLCDELLTEKIIEIFSVGFENNDVWRNVSIAHAYEEGLLSDDNKPDYENALRSIEHALLLKPNKQMLKKERAFYRYMHNSADLNELDRAFMNELNNKLDSAFLTTSLQRRLCAYNSLNFENESASAMSMPIVESQLACSSSMR